MLAGMAFSEATGGVACVGAVIHDDSGRLLLIRRATDPGRGRWSIPGGRVEKDERQEAAVVREVAEETGLHVTVAAEIGTVVRTWGERTYVITDFACTLADGTAVPRAGDDADDVGWVPHAELGNYSLVDGLLEALTDWRIVTD